MSQGDARTTGYRCPMCRAPFMLKSRLEQHAEAERPVFSARSDLKRQLSEARWRTRQVEIGRMRPDGTWITDWRPGIRESGPAPLELDGNDD